MTSKQLGAILSDKVSVFVAAAGQIKFPIREQIRRSTASGGLRDFHVRCLTATAMLYRAQRLVQQRLRELDGWISLRWVSYQHTNFSPYRMRGIGDIYCFSISLQNIANAIFNKAFRKNATN
jgi:hypothetical protein